MFKKFLSFQQWFWTQYLDEPPARFGFSLVVLMVTGVFSLVLAFIFGSKVPLLIYGFLLILSFCMGVFVGTAIFIRNRVREWQPYYEKEQRRLFETIKHSERQY